MSNTWLQRLATGETQTQEFKTSFLRNKLVAEAFYLTTSIEKYGSGFIRMSEAMVDYPEVQLLVEEISGGISITFSKSPFASHEALNGGVNGGVSNAQDLNRLIAHKPGLNTIALVELSQAPQRTIERWLKQLKDSGHIEFRGAPKSGGYHPKVP